MLQIYSTDQRAKIPFTPRLPGRVSMYVCGPTVYNLSHIGNARPAVMFDTIRRHLEASGFAVTYISNITDIDDKIIKRAAEIGVSCSALTSRYQDEYERDMTALGVRAPSIRPKATEHIPEMIALIEGLMQKGIAYATPRGVWFDVRKFPAYGKLSGRSMDDEATEHRVEQDPEKRNAQDFALWKLSKPGEPAWDSPWGQGRPGWHIECSAMSGKFCDFQIDIHGGGTDLCFPHHENEIAQSEAFSGKPFVRCWMHNGFITVPQDDGQEAKMGKSKGNMFVTREALSFASGAAIRLWMLGTHYRAPLLYKPEFLKTAESGLERIYNCLEALTRLADTPQTAGTPAQERLAFLSASGQAFRDALDDDFNTPQALAVLHDFLSQANTAVTLGLGTAEATAVRNELMSLLGILGLPYERPKAVNSSIDGLMRLLVEIRNEARKTKNFPLSDQIRDGLKSQGIELNDRSGETTWTVKS